MADEQDGGPAFPRTNERDSLGNSIAPGTDGMSLRDWFAGQAINGIWATADSGADFAAIASDAYAMADAMLQARAAIRAAVRGGE